MVTVGNPSPPDTQAAQAEGWCIRLREWPETKAVIVLDVFCSAWIRLALPGREAQGAIPQRRPVDHCVECGEESPNQFCRSCHALLHDECMHSAYAPFCSMCEADEHDEAAEAALEAASDVLARDSACAEATAHATAAPIAGGLRLAWHQAQRTDPALAPLIQRPGAGYRLSPADGVLEREVKQPGTGGTSWLPVVPAGQAAPHLTWRKWIWQVHHTSLVGGHRPPDATEQLLRRVCWWPKMSGDLAHWAARCVTCAQLRREPRKAPQFAVRATQYDPWQDVVVDMEGPPFPA